MVKSQEIMSKGSPPTSHLLIHLNYLARKVIGRAQGRSHDTDQEAGQGPVIESRGSAIDHDQEVDHILVTETHAGGEVTPPVLHLDLVVALGHRHQSDKLFSRLDISVHPYFQSMQEPITHSQW